MQPRAHDPRRIRGRILSVRLNESELAALKMRCRSQGQRSLSTGLRQIALRPDPASVPPSHLIAIGGQMQELCRELRESVAGATQVAAQSLERAEELLTALAVLSRPGADDDR